MPHLKEYFKKFDFFPIQPSFFFHSKPTITTSIGAAISLVIALYTICLAIMFGGMVVTRSHPSAYSYRDYSKMGDKALNISNFMLAFIFITKNNSLFDIHQKNLYKYSIKYHIQNPDMLEDSTEPSEFDFIECKEEYFKGFPNTPHSTIKDLVENGVCIDIRNNIVEGAPMYNLVYKTVRINIKFNESEYTERFLEYQEMVPLRALLYYQSTLYEVDNYTDPFKKDIGISEFKLTPSFAQSYNLLFQSVISNRDDNIFFTSINSTNFFGFSQLIQTQFFYTEETEADFSDMFNMDINFEPYTTIYSRKYVKIQEALSQVVSFSNVGIIIGKFITHLLTKKEILSLLCKIHFKESKKEVKFFGNNSHTLINYFDTSFIPIKDDPSEMVISTGNKRKKFQKGSVYSVQLRKDKSDVKGNINQKNTSTTFSFPNKTRLRKLGICNCCFKKNIKIKKERKAISEYLEFEYLMKNYDELKRLQAVFFNRKQLYLFKFIGKQYNALDNEPNLLINETRDGCSRYYQNKIDHSLLDDIDKKLLRLIDEKDQKKLSVEL